MSHGSDLHRSYLCVAFSSAPAADGTRIPLEVGIAVPGGSVRSFLIAPHPSWPKVLRDVGADVEADLSASRGVRADALADWAAAAMAGRALLSESAHAEQALLDRLLAAGGSGGRPRLEPFFATLDYLRGDNDALDAASLNAWSDEIGRTRDPSGGAGERARLGAEMLSRVLGTLRAGAAA